MNYPKALFTAVLTSLLFCVSASAEDKDDSPKDDRPNIEIITFDVSPFIPRNFAVLNAGAGLADLFAAELAKTGKYQVLERTQLGDLIDEIDLGDSGYIDKETAVRKGRLKGPEYLFLATITRFDELQKQVAGGSFSILTLGMAGLQSNEANVRLDFRIVDSTTGDIVYAGFGTGSDKNKNFAVGGGVWSGGGGTLNISSSSFLDSRLGRATLKAITDVIDKMDHDFLAYRVSGADALRAEKQKAEEDALKNNHGKVLAAVDDRFVIISLGTDQGIHEGDEIGIFKQESVYDSRGTLVYTEESEIGLAKIIQVQADRAKAEAVSGAGFAEGQIVRKR